MRLNALILALCVCVSHTRAASINVPEKKLDDLDNVDLDNVAVDPELLIQDTSVKEIENNFVKKIEDIPVKVIEEPVLDENSNDYVPSEEDASINIKRIEVDLENPGLPQRQEHETQNPENYGEKEKALFAIKQTIDSAQQIFNDGIRGVSNSFKTFFTPNEDLPTIQENIKNLKDSFTGQIVKINDTIRNYLKPDVLPSSEERKSNLDAVKVRLESLEKNFNTGLSMLSEGVEVYSIIKEEDEAEKAVAAKSDIRAESEAASTSDTSSEKPAEKPVVAPPTANPSKPAETPTNPWGTFISNMQSQISSTLNNLNVFVTGAFNGNGNGNQQSSTSAPGLFNFFQGINVPNFLQGSSSQAPPAQVQETSKPSGAQSDTAAPASPPPAAPAPWGPQAFIQQVQTSLSNFINPGQNNQKPQDSQQTQTSTTGITNPFQQAINNIVSIIRPDSNTVTQQPASVAPASVPAQTPEKTQDTVSATKPQESVPVQNSNAVPASNDQPQLAQPAQPNAVSAPAQPGPIQQLVQNNPIIKGIQNAVQRLQGTPNPETPRDEVVSNDNIKNDSDPKGHYGSSTGQGDNNDGSGLDGKNDEERIEVFPVKSEEEIAEIEIKPEELKAPAISDKTE